MANQTVQLNIRIRADERRLLKVGALRCRLSFNDYVLALLRPAIEEAGREDVEALRRRVSGSTGSLEEKP